MLLQAMEERNDFNVNHETIDHFKKETLINLSNTKDQINNLVLKRYKSSFDKDRLDRNI